MTSPGWIQRVLGTLPKQAKHTASGIPPRPLSRDRLAAYLRRRGYRFALDEDGDLTGTWDGSRFWFLLLGEHEEILQVRGRWSRALPLEHRTALGLAVNDWNRERIWPKAYVREEEGLLALYCEVSTDLEAGATDDQLAQLVACGLGTGVQMFAALDAVVPPPGGPTPAVPDD